MKYLFILTFGLFTLSCTKEQLTPSGNVTTQTITTTAFSKIEAQNGFDIKIYQNNSNKIEIEADDNIIEHIETGVIGSTLVVKLNDKVSLTGRKATINIKIFTPELTSLLTSGGTNTTFPSTFNFSTLNVNISGGGSLNGNITSCAELNCKTSGGSTMALTGKCTLLNLNISGGGDCKSLDLEVETAKLELSGGSNVHINVTKIMNVEASGGSTIKYKGDATCTDPNLSGGSTISKL